MSCRTRCLSILLLAASAPAAKNPCDPGLAQAPSNPLGYRLRGDRCEGVYIQEVAGSPLTVASWTAAYPDYDPALGSPLSIRWTAPPNAAVHLRAQSMRRRLYYRMDAEPGGSSFTWPSDLLAALGVRRPELGIMGYYTAVVGGAERRILAPLRIGQASRAPDPSGYRLALEPGVELEEVFVTVVNEETGAALQRSEALGRGYYPAERPVEISVAAPPKPGIYRVEIAARLRGGGASSAEIWFYHPRR